MPAEINDGQAQCAVNFLKQEKLKMIKSVENHNRIENKIRNQLQTIHSDVKELCNTVGRQLFNLDGCEEDEIMEGLWYEAAVCYAMDEKKTSDKHRNLEEDFYKHISRGVDKAWKRTSEEFTTVTYKASNSISTRAGKALLDLRRKKMIFPYNNLPRTYEDLYILTKRLCEFMRRRDEIIPTRKVVDMFIRHCNAGNPPTVSTTKRHCHSDRNEQDCIKGYESTEGPNPILKATSIATLRIHLPSACLDDHGNLRMSDEDQLKFINCPFVASIIFDYLTQLLSKGPLDHIAGITTEYSKFVGNGPSIKLYLQAHPLKQGRCVNVVILENYVSHEYGKNWRCNVNAMKFQKQEGKEASLRIATEAQSVQSERHRPHMTFGSNPISLRWYETDLIHEPSLEGSSDEYESGVLRMTEVVYRTLDEAILEAKRLFIGELERNPSRPPDLLRKRKLDEDSNSEEDSEVQVQSSAQSSNLHGNKYNVFDITPGEPHDAPDSLVSHCSHHNRTFSSHSDTRPMKFCNHDNKRGKHHENLMRILTHCGVASINNDETIPSDLVSIKHGIPNRDGGEFCRLIGYFSFSLHNGKETKGFVSCKPSDSISMGGMFHAHCQLWGSQESPR